jgi:hypothetical protein
MNFKDLLKIINEESREQADSFRTPGEAAAKEKAKNTPGDEKAKDAARKRAERAKQVPRSRKSKADLLKDIVVVKTKSGRVQLIFKDSFDKAKHELLSRDGSTTYEEAKKVSQDPKFEQTGASKLLLGNVKEKPKSEKKEGKKEEEKGERKEKSSEAGKEKKEKGEEDEGEEAPRRLSKQEMEVAMSKMSAEQLAMLPPEVRDEYFKKQRTPPTNQDFDNTTYEGLSVQFGISPVSSLPFNQQVLNAILFLTKLKVGAGQQEMQTFSALNPGSTDFTKRAFLQANKILSQIGDECLNNLLSAAEGGTKQMYTEGSVDMKCGDYKFKIEAGGEFSVSSTTLNQTNKTFRGLLSTALNTALSDPNVMNNDPGVKKIMAAVEELKPKTSNILISQNSLAMIAQNPEYVKQLQNTPVVLGDGSQAGTVLDAEGNLNPAASLEAYTTSIEKSGKNLFKRETDTEKSPVANSVAREILKTYLRGDNIKTKDQQPNHLITVNGVFALTDDYLNTISSNAVLSMVPSKQPIDGDNINNFKDKSLQSLKQWRALIEDKQQKKMPSLKELLVPIEKINPLQIVSNYIQGTMDFDFNASLIPGFKPKDLNSVEYNYVRIGNKVTKIPVIRGDRIANQVMSEMYIELNNLLVEALTNNFVLNSLVKVNILSSEEASGIRNPNVLLENSQTTLKQILENMCARTLERPFKLSLLEQIILEKYKRDYAMEYRNYHGKPKQRKERAKRTKAREMMIKKGKAKKGDGVDIDHKKPLRSGGSNGINNLRKRNKSDNRSDNGHKKGEKQNKDWK